MNAIRSPSTHTLTSHDEALDMIPSTVDHKKTDLPYSLHSADLSYSPHSADLAYSLTRVDHKKTDLPYSPHSADIPYSPHSAFLPYSLYSADIPYAPHSADLPYSPHSADSPPIVVTRASSPGESEGRKVSRDRERKGRAARGGVSGETTYC
eukprot:GHVN01021949.1.p1 GENE.GHVN01021949.1~~GHVN01021949.1.p1  ORF type:complete len:152 (+),score=53.13 GHVN01021949.1:342-797(+)